MKLTTKNCPAGNRYSKKPAITLGTQKGTIRFNLSAAQLLDFDTKGNKMSFEVKNGELFIFWDLRDGFTVEYQKGSRTYLLYNMTLAKTLWNYFSKAGETSVRFEIGEFHEGKYRLIRKPYDPKKGPLKITD